MSFLCAGLFAVVSAAADPRIPTRLSSGKHGYKSSESWLPRVPVISSPTGEELVAETRLPQDFDWRNVSGRSWVTTDLNQHIPRYCGSCWVHGAVQALNDRIKIFRGGRFPDVLLSRQAINNCVPDPSSSGPPPGCNGGDAWMIHKYMHEHKIPDDSCLPYSGLNEECVPVNVCRNCFHKQIIEPDGHPFFTAGPCFGVPHFTGYGVKEYGNLSGEVAMMKEIYARGPIACNTATDDTFVYNYTENAGVVKHNVYITDVNYTRAQIDHVMTVSGWGTTESGVPFWVVRNSWGTYWGDMGWVKIRRGADQMLIESGGCDWAVPDVEDVEEQLLHGAAGDYISGITVKTSPPQKRPFPEATAEVLAEVALEDTEAMPRTAPAMASEPFSAAQLAGVAGVAALGGTALGATAMRAFGSGRRALAHQQRALLG